MKVRSAIRKMCPHCQIIKKGTVRYVICLTNPRHKQRQGFSTLINQFNMPNMTNQLSLYHQIPKLQVTIQDLYTEAAINSILFSNKIIPNK